MSFLAVKKQKTYRKDKKLSDQTQNIEHTSQTKQKEQQLTITDSSLYPEIATNKQIMMDLRVQLNTGEKINVEIQSVLKKKFLTKSPFLLGQTLDRKPKKSRRLLSPLPNLFFDLYRLCCI